nr:type I 3-dehydroquinate dehydratase [Bacillota bacterium]
MTDHEKNPERREISRICMPITGSSKNEIIRQTEKAMTAKCGMIEWRADYLWAGDPVSVHKDPLVILDILDTICRISKNAETGKSSGKEEIKNKTVIFTLRTKEEGGKANLKRSAYMEIIRDVIQKSRVDMVDIELLGENGTEDKARLEFIVDIAHDEGKKVILSNHDFERTPDMEVITGRMDSMKELGADIVKVAYMPCDDADVDVLMDAAESMQKKNPKMPLVVISMGENGKRTREGSEAYEPAIYFISGPGGPSAPGQG